MRTLGRGLEAASEGTPENVRFDTPFITGERLHSIKIKCFIEKTENNLSEEDAQYSDEYEKMLWMREARIRTFMQLELEACQEEIIWMIRCHNCEALNRPQEEYPARPLPIPPNYIDNLHSILIKVQQGALPPTLKMILKTRYHLPAPTTSPRTVQPDYVMRGHRDGDNSPQKRPRASEENEEVVVNGIPSTDEGGDFISQTKVDTNHEPSKLADRQELVIFRQQKRTPAKSTDWGGDYPIQADFAENTNTVTAARVAAREEAAIGKHRQGTASTDENKQYDPGGTGDNPPKWPCCILYALLCVFLFCFAFLTISPCYHAQVALEMEAISTYMETRGAAFELSHKSSRSMIKRVLLYRDFLCTWTIGG